MEGPRAWYVPLTKQSSPYNRYIDDLRRPDLQQRLVLAKLFLELAQHYTEVSLFEAALSVLQEVLASDDQEVMGWYLEGWCLLLMSENMRASSTTAEGVTWTDLAHDARECLDMCKNVRFLNTLAIFLTITVAAASYQPTTSRHPGVAARRGTTCRNCGPQFATSS